jgi:hypothetical protein
MKKPNRTQTEKTEKKPSQTSKKPSQTETTNPNRFEPVFILKTKPNQNRSVGTGFGFF